MLWLYYSKKTFLKAIVLLFSFLVLYKVYRCLGKKQYKLLFTKLISHNDKVFTDRKN